MQRSVTHKSSLSAFTLLLTSMILDPARSCITSPDVTMGLMPSSIQVPLHPGTGVCGEVEWPGAVTPGAPCPPTKGTNARQHRLEDILKTDR